jgi:hypothetical protein
MCVAPQLGLIAVTSTTSAVQEQRKIFIVDLESLEMIGTCVGIQATEDSFCIVCFPFRATVHNVLGLYSCKANESVQLITVNGNSKQREVQTTSL